MFSKLFRRGHSTSLTRPEPEVETIKNFFQAACLVWKQSKKDEQLEQELIIEIQNVCWELAKCLEKMETAITQKRISRAFELVVELHKSAKHALMEHKSCVDMVAQANDLFMISLLRYEWPRPTEASKQIVYRYSHEIEFPEYIFISELFFSASDESKLRVSSLIFCRITLELFIASARVIHLFESSRVIDIDLAAVIVELKNDLHRLVVPDSSTQQLIAYENERDATVKAMTFERGGLLGERLSKDESVAGLEAEEVEEVAEEEDSPSELFLEFIRVLEKDYHRRDIFLAIATLNYFKKAERPTFNGFWEWGEKHLINTPYETMILGHFVEVAFTYGAINHRGLLDDPNKANGLKKISCQKNCYKNIHPIAERIKAFLQEKNIRNIPSIP